MQTPPFPILYEDNHLLVIDKPAELPTMGVAAELPSVLTLAKEYIKKKYNKPGNVYLGIVSRLDAPVTGVLVLARTSKAAARLSEQFRKGEVEKTYWAVVEQAPEPSSGPCRDWVRKDERHRKMHITSADAEGAKEARLNYRTLQQLTSGSLLEVELETGRKHQIRLQLGSRGCPIVGDRKYGSRQPLRRGIALHARTLSFRHPVQKTELEFKVPLPAIWKGLGVFEES